MKKKTKLLIVLSFVVAALAIAVTVVLLIAFKNYTVNKPDKETELAVPPAMSLYSGDDIGFSFLFPAGLKTGWSDEDGAYIYCGSNEEVPYVLVNRKNKAGMSPERYFSSCDKLMTSSFISVQSTPIHEVAVGDKMLYLTRYVCSDGNNEYVIDRYLELYGSFYIEYTAISGEAGSLNTPAYYATSTLKVTPGAYAGAYSDKTTLRVHPDVDVSIKLPDMLVVKDLTIGYFASGENAVMLCVRCTEDDTGVPIYNRKDFIDRAAASPDFVAGRLGADSATFTEGTELTLGGKSFFCYPMEMQVENESFSGALCLANDEENGCWLLCYAVREGAPEQEKLLALCQTCAESIDFK